MKSIYYILFFSSLSFSSFGQRQFFTPSDTLNKGRLIGTSIGVGGVWAGSMIALGSVWYSDIEKSKFHFYNDSKNWLQMDKMGHFYAANKITMLTTDLYTWSGMNKKKAVWIGAGVGLGYQTTFEIFDGFSTEWGFSWSDMMANVVGTATYTAQILIWNEERIISKFSYHPTEFAAIRPEVLGSTFSESLLKDYNGQTYWLSFSPGTFFKNSSIPKWACLSFGYSVDEKLVGDQEYYIDGNGNEYFSKREFLFSLDIDFSKFDIKRPWLRTLVKQLNYLKIPFPALILSDGKLTGNGLYF